MFRLDKKRVVIAVSITLVSVLVLSLTLFVFATETPPIQENEDPDFADFKTCFLITYTDGSTEQIPQLGPKPLDLLSFIRNDKTIQIIQVEFYIDAPENMTFYQFSLWYNYTLKTSSGQNLGQIGNGFVTPNGQVETDTKLVKVAETSNLWSANWIEYTLIDRGILQGTGTYIYETNFYQDASAAPVVTVTFYDDLGNSEERTFSVPTTAWTFEYSNIF